MKLKFILNGILMIISFVSFSADLPTFDIEKSPEWKTQILLVLPEKDYSTSGDVSYILLDWQENNLKHESNSRFVLRLNNEEGVQNNSQLTIGFDPTYQKLAINKIIIHRGKIEINHLNRSEIELMRNEKNADRLIYDGSYSAVIILKDVRVGDVLEYEYTIKGENPILSGHIYSYVTQSFSSEVFRIYQRVLVPAKEVLSMKAIQEGQMPVITVIGNIKSLVWDISNRPAIFMDANTPSWYNAYPACEISSFKDWQEVKRWGRNLFKLNIETPQLDTFIRDMHFVKSDQGIADVIRFVQDEIRYLGIETGIHSHQPHHPEEVLKNRFGDCKDKTYLLVVMLRKLGVEAWPAYLNSSNKGHVDDNVPSPYAFNHVIVKFRYDNIDYWVDPTINQQRGPLSLVCLPAYQKALVLDEKSSGFEDIPVSKSDKVVIHENLWFADSTSEVKYEVESVYYGNMANTKRSYHLGTPLAEIRENYINYCSGYYSNLKWKGDSALKYTDYPETNTFKVRESYVIPDFWDHRATDSVEWYATINPYNLYEFLSHTKDKSRKMPLSIYFPVDVNCTIDMHFPPYKEIGFQSETDSIVNKVYTFYRRSSVNQNKHTYTLNYTYKTKADHVPVADQKAYFKDYDRLSDLCDENIKWGMAAGREKKVFWPSILVSFLFITLLLWILRIVYQSDFGITYTGKKPLDFGSWLIFPIIGLYFTPLMVIVQIFKTGYFNQSLWDNFMAQYGGSSFLTGSFYYFELLFNISIIVVSIFLIVLMNQKRVTFPRLFIWFRVVVLAGFLFDTVISNVYLNVEITNFSEIAREVMGVAIWVPYMVMSERVKKTFVNTYKKLVPEEPAIEESTDSAFAE
jgi:hypothetical protein